MNQQNNGSSVQRERVTEAETAELICRATGGKFVDLGFGPSGAWLQPGAHNDWARDAQRRRIMSGASEQGILNTQWNAAQMACLTEEQRQRPFMLLRPKIQPDGDQWCVLYGDNLHDGVAGFGDTPEKAAEDFDKNWRTQTLRKGEGT